eukprot:TRINITY_DN2359_c0_g1_i1.p1 TRINITY_DN2359_c0_g1~~TRINITY_DN2359_c0_g1_i1.p1  ORF type:complete len:359 (-),score=100.27 TRINITY_DN2359_c0_g1_i1:224-1300(-)
MSAADDIFDLNNMRSGDGCESSFATVVDLEIFRYVIGIISAHNLRKADLLGKSDPYVKITVGNVTQQTRVIKRNLNPTWNEQFVFNVDKACEVVFEVFDWDAHSKHDFLGSASVSYSELVSELRSNNNGSEYVKTLTLEHVEKGELDVSIRCKKIPVDWTERSLKASQKKNVEYMREIEILKREVLLLSKKLEELNEQKHVDQVQKFKSSRTQSEFRDITRLSFSKHREVFRFEILVLSALELPAHDFNGKSDPYVVVRVGEQSKQTEVMYETLEPVWSNGSFSFVVEELPSEIKFTVMDWGTFRHDELGSAEVQTTDMFGDGASVGRMNLELNLSPKGKLRVLLTYFKLVTAECYDS